MKRFFCFILFAWMAFLFTDISFGSDFLLKDITLSERPNQENTEENIKSAQIIEKYFIKYKNDLEAYRNDYDLKDDVILRKNIDEIQTIIFQLRKIQTNKIEKSIAESIIWEARERVKDMIRSLNSYLKNITEVIQEDTRIYQDSISLVLLKISEKLDLIIWNYEKKFWDKRIFSARENQIKSHLKILSIENKKLKNFSKFYFRNKKALISNLKWILIKIRSEISNIKSI